MSGHLPGRTHPEVRRDSPKKRRGPTAAKWALLSAVFLATAGGASSPQGSGDPPGEASLAGAYASAPGSEGRQTLTLRDDGTAVLRTAPPSTGAGGEEGGAREARWRYTPPYLLLDFEDSAEVLEYRGTISLDAPFGLKGSHPGLLPAEKKKGRHVTGTLWREPLVFLEDGEGRPLLPRGW